MTNYFDDCKTQQEADKKRKVLAKKLHPDGGGSNQEFVQMNLQYEKFVPHGQAPFQGFTFTGNTYRTHANVNREKFGSPPINENIYESPLQEGLDHGTHFQERFNNSGIPLDHPIHQLVRQLRNQLLKQTEELKLAKHEQAESRMLRQVLNESIERCDKKNKEIESLKRKLTRLKKKLESLTESKGK